MDDITWGVKYTPKTWEELILPPSPMVHRVIESLFTTGKIPTTFLLLYGRGGTGKSTLVDLLTSQPRWQVHELSTHGENKSSLEGLERTIMGQPFDSRRWLIIANEIEKSTNAFLDGLRTFSDMNAKRESNDKFLMIMTDNHITDLRTRAPEVFDGERTIEICWDLVTKEALLKRCFEVLKLEDKDTTENRKIAIDIVNLYHPSIRKCLLQLQLSVL